MRIRDRFSVLSSALLVAAACASFGASAAFGAPLDGDTGAPAAPVQEPDATTEHLELERGFRKARNAYYAARREYAERKATDESASPPTAPEAEWAARYMAVAERRAGSEGAVPFLVSVVSMTARSLPDVAKQALDTLVGSHVASPRLDELTFSLIYYGRSLEGATAENALDKAVDTLLAELTPPAEDTG